MLILTPVLLSETPVYAGASFKELSHSTSILQVKDPRVMERIIQQVRLARLRSTRKLSQEEIDKIISQAEQAVENQSKRFAQPGASVYMGSEIID